VTELFSPLILAGLGFTVDVVVLVAALLLEIFLRMAANSSFLNPSVFLPPAADDACGGSKILEMTSNALLLLLLVFSVDDTDVIVVVVVSGVVELRGELAVVANGFCFFNLARKVAPGLCWPLVLIADVEGGVVDDVLVEEDVDAVIVVVDSVVVLVVLVVIEVVDSGLVVVDAAVVVFVVVEEVTVVVEEAVEDVVGNVVTVEVVLLVVVVVDVDASLFFFLFNLIILMSFFTASAAKDAEDEDDVDPGDCGGEGVVLLARSLPCTLANKVSLILILVRILSFGGVAEVVVVDVDEVAGGEDKVEVLTGLIGNLLTTVLRRFVVLDDSVVEVGVVVVVDLTGVVAGGV